MRIRCSVLVTLAAAAGLSAQQTYVVDPQGGGQFTNLGAAIAAASAGDTLLLRGSLLPATLDKPLRLVGDPSATVHTLTVQAPGGPVTIAKLGIHLLDLQACTASLEDLLVRELRIDASVVLGRDCEVIAVPVNATVATAVTLRGGSTAAFESCTFAGTHFWIAAGLCGHWSATPALRLEAGNNRAELSNCAAVGGPGQRGPNCNHLGAPGIVVDSGASVALSGCFVAAGVTSQAPPITGSGLVETDSSNIVGGHAAAVPVLLPETRGAGAPPGGAMSCEVRSDPGLPAVLATSLGVRAPVTVPDPQGNIWIDLGAFLVLRIGVLDGNGRMTASIAVPAGIQRGLPLTVQGAVQDPATGALRAAVPTVVHVL